MIAPRWRKVFRDLLSNKTKTILVVLAIAVGLFAFGGVFITQDILVAGMDSQYRATNSANIIISTDLVDEGLLRWVRQQPEVGYAQGKASYWIKMYGKDKTYNLTLVAYDDYSNITMNKVTPQEGAWPPERNKIIFERASLPLTSANIGDSVTLEDSNGKKFVLPITGTVHDLNAFPGTMVPLPTAYVSLETLQWLGFPGQCNQLNIVTKERITEIPELEAMANILKQRMQDRGIAVYSTQVKNAEEHWAKTTTESFTLILSGLGIFSLILSGFLVVNTITALIAQQKRQIGMMKAVGGTGRQIISLYLVLVSFYGLLALFIAIPISLGLGYFFMGMVANLLNIDIIGFHLPMRVLLLELGAALLVPAIAAALPITSGVKVSVREALTDYGISGKIKTGAFDRFLFKIQFLSRPMLLSLRNTFRRKSRLALTLGSLTLAGTLFIGVMNIRASLDTEFNTMFKKYYDWEIALGLDGYYPIRSVESRVLSIPGVVDVESQLQMGVQRVKDDGSKGTSFTVIGLPPNSEYTKPDIKEGRWLTAGDRNVMVVTSALLDDMPDVKLGSIIKVKINEQNRDFEIVGIVPQTWEKTAYADMTYLSHLQGVAGMTSSLFLRIDQKDGPYQTAMAEIVETKLKDAGIKVNSSITQEAIVSSNAKQVDFLIYFLLIMALLSAVVGALGMMGMMGLNVMERTREIGVMRSIGAASLSIGSIVITEGLIIGIVSWLLALPVSVPISMIFNYLLGDIMFATALPFIISPTGIIVWLIVVLAIAFIASVLPAYRAMRMSVRETLAYE